MAKRPKKDDAASAPSGAPPLTPDETTAELEGEEARERRLTCQVIFLLEYRAKFSHGNEEDRVAMQMAANRLRFEIDLPKSVQLDREGHEL